MSTVNETNTLDLNDVVKQTTPALERCLGPEIEFVTRLGPSLWLIVADGDEMGSMLLHLAANSRAATPGRGVFAIDTETLHVDDAYASMHTGLRMGRYVRLRASDSGTGLPPTLLTHVAEPLNTIQELGDGAGAGLTAIYAAVAHAGGTARFFSEPGVGTTFTALFPAAVGAEAEPRDGASPVQSGTVLIVEDEPALLEVARRMLHRNGYRVLTATNGDAAIAAAEAHDGPIDFLLTDIVMPGMLGVDVAARIQAARPGICVIYMSGFAPTVLTARGSLAQGALLLEKPFTQASLLATLRTAAPPT